MPPDGALSSWVVPLRGQPSEVGHLIREAPHLLSMVPRSIGSRTHLNFFSYRVHSWLLQTKLWLRGSACRWSHGQSLEVSPGRAVNDPCPKSRELMSVCVGSLDLDNQWSDSLGGSIRHWTDSLKGKLVEGKLLTKLWQITLLRG